MENLREDNPWVFGFEDCSLFSFNFCFDKRYRCSHLEHKPYFKKLKIPRKVPLAQKKVGGGKQTDNLGGDSTFLAGIELSGITLSRFQLGNVH